MVYFFLKVEPIKDDYLYLRQNTGMLVTILARSFSKVDRRIANTLFIFLDLTGQLQCP